MSRCVALVTVAAWAAAPAIAAPPVQVTSFGRLPMTFEKNTGRYDKRVKFLARTSGATVFITQTEMVMVMRGKANGEPRAESQELRANGTAPTKAGHTAPTMSSRAAVTNPAFAGWEANRRRSVSCAQTGDSSPGRDRLSPPLRRSLSALSSQPSATSHVLRMKLVGANAKAVATGLEKQPGIVNYFIGNDPKKWRTRVPTYARAKLAAVYPGIDLVYYGAEPRAKGREPRAGGVSSLSALGSQLSAIEYDFVVHPGADPKRIQLAFEGADRIRVADGDLILSTPAGEVRMKRPYAYQTIGGKRVQVACDYRLTGRGATLRVARYDASRALVVDPMVLAYSTLLGGSQDDRGTAIAVDTAGAAYIAGGSASTDFPTTSGAYQEGASGNGDGVVTKLSPDGSALVYSTFLGGGDGNDMCWGVGLASDGCAYVAGTTWSGRFPTTPGAYRTTQAGYQDGFISKLDASGSALIYSTYVGGTHEDYVEDLAVDDAGCAHITGMTYSRDYPVTPDALDQQYNGYYGDAFVTKLNATGSALAYSTYLGGSELNLGEGITVGADGCALVTGQTVSVDFPTTPGAYDTIYSSGGEAFVAKLTADGRGLVYSTFLGGPEGAWRVATDPLGNAYVVGGTTSAALPTTPNAHDATYAGGGDVFLAKLSATGDALLYCTYIGGSGRDSVSDLTVDGLGCAYTTGWTESLDFPTTPDAFDRTCRGATDVFLLKLDTVGGELTYSTYLGGPGSDYAGGIAVDALGYAYVTGFTRSDAFPTTPGAFDGVLSGSSDAYVVKSGLCAGERWATGLYCPDRVGIATEFVTLRGYLWRTSDGFWLNGRAIAFEVDGSAVGAALTGASGAAGRADLVWQIPAGPRDRAIVTRFEGEPLHSPSVASAALTALTVNTKMSVYMRAGRITEYTTLRALLLRTDNTPVIGKLVSFYVDGTAVGSGTTNANGRALIGYTIADGAGAGSRVILADWPGDGGYRASSSATALFVAPALPYIWVLPKTIPQGAIANLYAYFRRLDDLQKQIGKDVVFSIDGTPVGSVTTDASAVARHLYHTTEPPGTYTIRCEFAGDAWVEAGYGEAALTIY